VSRPILVPDFSESPILVPDFSESPILVPDFSESPILVPDFSESPILVPDFSESPILVGEALLCFPKRQRPTSSLGLGQPSLYGHYFRSVGLDKLDPDDDNSASSLRMRLCVNERLIVRTWNRQRFLRNPLSGAEIGEIVEPLSRVNPLARRFDLMRVAEFSES
jgi:hypothetical protein